MVSNMLHLPLALKKDLEFTSCINTGKVRCGVANHLLNVCQSSASNVEYLQVQLIEKVSVQNDDELESFVGKKEILASTIIYFKPQVK